MSSHAEMSGYLSQKRRSIGSSYLIQQSPGAEQVGGLEIALTFPSDGRGSIAITNTIYHSDEVRADIELCTNEALRGLHAYVAENDVDLSQFDVTLRRFFIHDVDSRPYLYFIAAQDALRSALAMWNPPPEIP